MDCLPFFRAIKSGIYASGPGRYRAFMAMRSSKVLGFSSFMYFCIPELSYWKMAIISPRWNNS